MVRFGEKSAITFIESCSQVSVGRVAGRGGRAAAYTLNGRISPVSHITRVEYNDIKHHNTHHVTFKYIAHSLRAHRKDITIVRSVLGVLPVGVAGRRHTHSKREDSSCFTHHQGRVQ